MPMSKRNPSVYAGSIKPVLFILGTRPEAIKLCPVIRHMAESRGTDGRWCCVTAQHRADAGPGARVLRRAAGLRPEPDVARPDAGRNRRADPHWRSTRCSPNCARLWPWSRAIPPPPWPAPWRPFTARIPVGHVEAGLRTGDLAAAVPGRDQPPAHRRGWPRCILLPPNGPRCNLLAEGTPAEPHPGDRQFRHRRGSGSGGRAGPGRLPPLTGPGWTRTAS